jgi:hypothetical protein
MVEAHDNATALLLTPPVSAWRDRRPKATVRSVHTRSKPQTRLECVARLHEGPMGLRESP